MSRLIIRNTQRSIFPRYFFSLETLKCAHLWFWRAAETFSVRLNGPLSSDRLTHSAYQTEKERNTTIRMSGLNIEIITEGGALLEMETVAVEVFKFNPLTLSAATGSRCDRKFGISIQIVQPSKHKFGNFPYQTSIIVIPKLYCKYGCNFIFLVYNTVQSIIEACML